MDAVTYPNDAVANAIATYFEPVQINTQDGSANTTATVRRFRQVWTPDLRILDGEGVELYRWNGYLPPGEFLPQLLAGRAQALLRSEQGEEAAAAYAEILRTYPTSFVGSEVAYFTAVAQYRVTHEPADLLGTWGRLQARYPMSEWRTKQSFTEKPPE
jgi:hypothetical protein